MQICPQPVGIEDILRVGVKFAAEFMNVTSTTIVGD